MAHAINLEPQSAVTSFPTALVYVRASWQSEWQLVPYLRCNSISHVVGPGIDEAELEYQYGYICREDQLGYVRYDPLEIEGQYVKVVIAQKNAVGNDINPFVWVGRVQSVTGERFGVGPGPVENRVENGTQTFRVLGILFELTRVYVTTSVVQNIDNDKEVVRRGIGFNCGADNGHEIDDGISNNRSVNKLGENNTYIFSRKLGSVTDAKAWNADQVIKYLLQNHYPINGYKERAVQFKLHVNSGEESAYLKWSSPRLRTHGKSVKAILDELMDRRRLLGYRVRYVEDDNAVEIVPFSFAEESIYLEDEGDNLPANESQRTIDADSGYSFGRVVVRKSLEHQAQQVIVRSGRRGAVFTVSYADGTLNDGWSLAEETSYDEGASGEGDYPEELTLRKQRNALVRQEDRHARVYRYFVLPSNWNGKAGNGIGGSQKYVCPKLNSAGNALDEGLPFWLSGLRLENRIPLWRDVDYSGTNLLDPDNPASVTPLGGRSEYSEPLVLVKLPVRTGGEPDRYALAHEPIETDPLGRLGLGSHRWSIRTRALDSGLGLSLDVIGAEQHMIAQGVFTEVDGSDEPAEVSYEDIIATVYMLTDEPVEAKYPDEVPVEIVPGSNDIAPARIFEFELREQLHLDWVVPNTVVGVRDGELQTTTSGGWVRDDRKRLKQLARLAYAWYSRYRSACAIEARRINVANTDNDSQFDDGFRLGDLITTIGSGGTATEVNSVITSIQLDLLSGTSIVQTDFAEFDLDQM